MNSISFFAWSTYHTSWLFRRLHLYLKIYIKKSCKHHGLCTVKTFTTWDRIHQDKKQHCCENTSVFTSLNFTNHNLDVYDFGKQSWKSGVNDAGCTATCISYIHIYQRIHFGGKPGVQIIHGRHRLMFTCPWMMTSIFSASIWFFFSFNYPFNIWNAHSCTRIVLISDMGLWILLKYHVYKEFAMILTPWERSHAFTYAYSFVLGHTS